MKISVFFIVVLILLTFGNSANATDWIIRIKNFTGNTMDFTVSYETPKRKMYTFKHQPSLKPNEYHEFLTKRGVKIKKNGARVEIVGKIKQFGLIGEHVERRWGDLNKGIYVKAKISFLYLKLT